MADNYLKNQLGDNEHVIFVTRQHWLVLVAQILSESMLAIAWVILITLIWRLWLPNPLVLLGYLLLFLPFLSLLRDVIIWTNRQYIVTNWRVIQISGVFSKEVTDSSLEKVNDVKLKQSFLGRLLDYGNIEILTASELGVNMFRRVEQPIRLKTAMLNAKEQLEQGQTNVGRKSETSVADLIAQLDGLRKQGVLSEEEFRQKKAQLLAKL
ncbi:MAG TPA: PH domain-containing protein [Pyrinomonadaceae bacterium]|nr:PH domain-containing protein [Pyrinomonadaceae bacterium]